MRLHDKYLILDEESNASDYLCKSLEFLEKIDLDRLYLKWFTIAFHGAVYHFTLLKLHSVNPKQIFKDNKTSSHALDRELIGFQTAYKFLKDENHMNSNPFKPEGIQDSCIEELNNQLRNQMIHFRPTLWAAEPWYFAEACYPLLDVLKFCINDHQFRQTENKKLLGYLERIGEILKKHIT